MAPFRKGVWGVDDFLLPPLQLSLISLMDPNFPCPASGFSLGPTCQDDGWDEWEMPPAWIGGILPFLVGVRNVHGNFNLGFKDSEEGKPPLHSEFFFPETWVSAL